MKEQTIGICDVSLHLGVEIYLLHGDLVRARILHRIASCYNIRWYIFREGSAGLHHRIASYAGFCILNHAATEHYIVANDAVAGNLTAISEDAIVAHFGVVRDVTALHQEVVVANNGLSTFVSSAVDDYIFANDVVVANDEFGLGAIVIKVLWNGSEHRTLKDLVVVSHSSASKNTGKGIDNAVVANDNIIFDVGEGIYFAVVTNLYIGGNFCFGTDFTCHILIV